MAKQDDGGLLESPAQATHVQQAPKSDGPPAKLTTAEPPKVGASKLRRLPQAPTVGKVFYWNPVTQQPGVCSASTINNQTKNMVLTAAHCYINEHGVELQEWVFIPGYRDGRTPFGVWHAQFYTMPNLWAEYQILEYDVALMTMYPLNGTEVVNAVGGNGLWINHNFPEVAIWGYPAAPPYDGQRQYYCLNRKTYEAPVLRVKAGCAMTKGASGGPWLKNFNKETRRGGAIGVTSTFAEPKGYIASPYFGGFVEDLYEAAKSL